MKSRKVVLDTNLWISFLITKDFSFLDKYIEIKNLNKTKILTIKELIEDL